ncbi:hypothetical protein C2G38_784102 [Gigaspora rosea]|uniref:Uncharacterized protein n=1 Tax=Gigaspora rosea TaxID=44941 RepID=A0A397VMV7_9GLOM|nr:hypothetical protein C2G38_784102 [Gigaspora rosea]
MDITFCLNCILLSSSSAYHWVTGTILFSATTSLRFASSGPDKLNQEYSFIYKLDCISKNKRSKVCFYVNFPILFYFNFFFLRYSSVNCETNYIANFRISLMKKLHCKLHNILMIKKLRCKFYSITNDEELSLLADKVMN